MNAFVNCNLCNFYVNNLCGTVSKAFPKLKKDSGNNITTIKELSQ